MILSVTSSLNVTQMLLNVISSLNETQMLLNVTSSLNETQMILSGTSSLNETQMISVRFPNSTKLEFGSAWVLIGAAAAVLFVLICMMWVISRQLQTKDNDDEMQEAPHQLGQPTFGANFLHPMVNFKAPGLTTGWYNFHPVKVAQLACESIDNRKPLLSNVEIYPIYKKSNI